jgi:hypothetical protein
MTRPFAEHAGGPFVGSPIHAPVDPTDARNGDPAFAGRRTDDALARLVHRRRDRMDSSFGYCQAVELGDSSVRAVYIHTGGHATNDARTEAL